MTNPNRQRAGQPTGGQFAQSRRPAAGVGLSSLIYTDDGFRKVGSVDELNEATVNGEKKIEFSFPDPVIIGQSDKPMRYRLRESANVTVLQGDATIELTDDAAAVVGGSIEVDASDRTRVQAYQYARVLASGDTQVNVRDNAFVEASGRSMVRAQDGALVDALREATVVAQDNATVSILDHGVVVTAMGKSEVQSFSDVAGRVIQVGDEVTVDHFDEHDELAPHPHHMVPVPKNPRWET